MIATKGNVEIEGSFRTLSRIYDELSAAIDDVPGEHEICLALEHRSTGHVLILCDPEHLEKLRHRRTLTSATLLHEAVELLRGNARHGDELASAFVRKYDAEET